MTFEELRNEIMKMIDEGADEASVEKYVIDHFKEFPEYMQGQILLAFVEDTLNKQEGEEVIGTIQKEGQEALNKIVALKAVLQLQ